MWGGVKGVTCYSVRVVRKDSQGRQHLSRDLKEVREVAVCSGPKQYGESGNRGLSPK